MSQNGVLQIDGRQYNTKIDEMELMCDLVNFIFFKDLLSKRLFLKDTESKWG
jgi:hypothetical protein